MEEKRTFVTKQGLEKIKDELEKFKNVKRKEIAKTIQESLGWGKISENPEYDQAKNEQAQLEGRISKIENILSNAVLIDEEEISTDIVGIGSKVLIKDLRDDEEIEYTIVGSLETDPLKGKISNESPLGKELLGKSLGASLEVQTPDGITKYKILDILK